MGNSKRLAVLSLLAKIEGETGRLGKKAIQKQIHILTSLKKKSFGYEFSFYTYGAFSRELAYDIDLAKEEGLINVSYNQQENSYSVTSTNRADEFIESNLKGEEKIEILNTWKSFSGKSARDLELLSTILYVFDDECLDVNSKNMTDRVKQLKPKYSDHDIVKSQEMISTIILNNSSITN